MTFNEIPNLEVFAYGKLELMILKHCILNNNFNKEEKCNTCKRDNKYYLEDRNKEKYQIITQNCKNIILHYKTINRLKEPALFNRLAGFMINIMIIKK